MALIEEFENIGNSLFKKRSYLPIVLYLIATIVIYFDRREFSGISNIYFALLCLVISLFGIVIRIITIGFAQRGTSGRNVTGQIADALNTKGIYSLVRHPLYLGNFFMWFGIVVYTSNIWLLIAVFLLYFIYYERIIFAEESFLRQKFGEVFTNWANTTPAIIPSFKNYRKNETRFNFKDVLKREYNGLTALAVSFAYIDCLRNYLYKSKFEIQFLWLYFHAITIIIFIVLRFLKKKTRLLNE